jgi:phosphatidylcholine synthase
MTDDGRRGSPQLAWCIHLLTASGLVLGFVALMAAIEGRAMQAVLWLLAAQVVDGIDGPLARAFRVPATLPKIDGNALDLVVDFVTCVLVPVVMLDRFHLLPPPLSLPAAALVLCSTALWFARTDMCTSDHWFNGFPGEWNLVVPTLLLLHTGRWFNLLVVVGCALLSLTSVKFVHPVRVDDRRTLTLAVTVAWLAALAWLTTDLPDGHRPLEARAILVLAPCYFGWLTLRRTFRSQHDVAPYQLAALAEE